nr:phosphatidate cytidylyltransferase [Treponemataceae bacterium]
MEVKKLLSRLAIFFLGIPAILAFVYFSQLHSLALHILLLLVVFGSSLEMHNLLKQKGKLAPKYFLAILAILPSIMSYFCNFFGLHTDLIFFVFTITVVILCSYEVIRPADKGENNFSASIHAICSDCFTLFYCGFLPVFISQLCNIEPEVYDKEAFIKPTTAYLSTYFILVFGCDSFAWLFGVTLGKNNRGII